jgi:hypothetical protein
MVWACRKNKKARMTKVYTGNCKGGEKAGKLKVICKEYRIDYREYH